MLHTLKKPLIFALSLLLCQPSYAGVYFSADASGADYLLSSHNSDIDCGSGNWAVYARIKTDTAHLGAIWGKGVSTGAGCQVYLRSTDPYVRIFISAGGFSSQTTTESTSPHDGAEHCLVAQRNGNDLEIFIDGTSVSDQTVTARDTTNTSNLYLGRREDAGSELPYDGKLYEVAFWKGAALSQIQIDQLCRGKVKRMPLQIQYANLEYYVPLNDRPDQDPIAGDTFRDVVNGYNATGTDADNDTLSIAEEVMTYP